MNDGESGTPRGWRWPDWLGRLSFQAKLALMVNLLIMLLILGSAVLVERRQRTAIIEEVEKRALLMAQALESATAADLVTYNYVSIEQSVDKFSRTPDLVYIFILDKEGNVAAQFVRDYPLRDFLNRRPVEQRLPGPAAQEVYVPGTDWEAVHDVKLLVIVEGSSEHWGAIRLGLSLKRMHQEIARTRWQIAGFGALVLILGSGAATALARRMTRPIHALTEGVAAVSRGDFGQRIDVVSRDELGQLSVSFNEMTVQLAHVRELEARLRRADRLAALGTMAAGIAHDIRNPLTSILIFSQLMSLHHDDPEVRAKFDRVVPRELERVQAVIEDMMELARSTALNLESTNLNEMLNQVMEVFEAQVAAQGIKTIREFETGLPMCMVDRKRLHRCFSNLVANGIQAMPKGGDLSIWTRFVPATAIPGAGTTNAGAGDGTTPTIRVTITDTGMGISSERLSRIFDPFYTTKEKGVGLGMAITHRIIEDHRGTIDVQSQVGLGTTFTVHLPANL